jgi:predicted nucleic acid-binding protein
MYFNIKYLSVLSSHQCQRLSEKEYSLTNFISMIVMKEMKITEVLTNGQHFAQEGFILLFPRSLS